ncbi:MAG: hypothetical protein GTN78_09330, partial [Gemmatimonadales bacterium]|nr:hypothetical protein [Gemmatimonadales bacterium]
NNYVAKDNRIPPYGMSYDEARVRNALPVPADQYGNPGPGGTYNYWDNVILSPPPGAAYAAIDLLYQPTSWEYIQFLYLANDGQNAFLANEGAYMLEAWLNTGMAAPYVMTSATWTPCPDGDGDGWTDCEEAYMGTLAAVTCPVTAAPNDEDPDAWGPDFNDSQHV